MQSRYYNPEIGRFLNADTITDGGSGVLGNNLFVYTANNPINNSDPTGHWIIKDALQKFANKVRSAVSYIKEKTTNTRGTYSSGRYASGTFGIWSFTAQIGISADTKGNIGIQGSFSCSATYGSASASVGKYTMKTNAPSINKLNGLGYSVGGSAIVPLPAPIGLDAGADLNIIPDNIDKTMYLGYTKYAGVATPTPGGEAHIGWGNTTTFTSFNVYDAIDSLCVKINEE